MYKKSLFFKLMVWMLLATTIPFLLSNLISYRSTSASLQTNQIEMNRKTMTIGMENVKKYLQELNLQSVSWYYDPILVSYLWLDKPDFDQTTYIDRQLESLYYSRSEIKLVNFYSAMSGQRFEKHNYSVIKNPQQLQLPSGRKEDWETLNEYEVRVLDGSRFLAIHKKLRDYPKPNVLGLMSMYFSLGEIDRLCNQLFDPGQEQMFLYLNRNQLLLYASGEMADANAVFQSKGTEKGYQFGVYNGKKGVYIIVHDMYLETPLTMIKFIPSDLMNQAAKQTLDQSLVIQFIALAFIILFASILSFSSIAPIKRLIRNMTRVELGQFDVEEFKTRDDEIGILELRFQTMVRNLKEMIIQEYQQRIEISTARLKMLQAQINPHFLYNTLQSIGTAALRHRMEDVSDSISQLGAILRYSMDLKIEAVPLQKEIEHIDHYLALQENRFKHKLTYTISCEPDALQVQVPKIILQPLVENSIIHGIEDGTGIGTIHLDIVKDSVLTIRIIDSGKGLDPQTIEQLHLKFTEQVVSKEEEGGIGLMNVLQRLKIKYGDQFQWKISSKPYEHTEILLVIPIQEEA